VNVERDATPVAGTHCEGPAMFEVTVTATFAASHGLNLADGTREPLHTHAWGVRVTLRGPRLDRQELLVDFAALRERLRLVLAPLNDKDLGAAPELAGRNPTAEVVAQFIATQLAPFVPGSARLTEVEVEEEPGCFARYIP
jgi:6-pyruvoyl-tetrahydropterin synthase